MKLTQVINLYTSQLLCRGNNVKLGNYINRGLPKRVMRDDGTCFYADRNITPHGREFRDKMNRLERLEKLQFDGCSGGHTVISKTPSSTSKKGPTSSSPHQKT